MLTVEMSQDILKIVNSKIAIAINTLRVINKGRKIIHSYYLFLKYYSSVQLY